jgi:hypothetical protein
LKISDKVKILNEADDIVAKIAEIREAVEEEPVAAAPAEEAKKTDEEAATSAGADKTSAGTKSTPTKEK